MDKTIFNLQRFQILQTKLNPNTSHLIPDDYAYAWYKGLYPFFGDNDLEIDLIDYFRITKTQIDVVSKRADSEWLKRNYYTFYDYETYFGVRGSNEYDLDRSSLIAIFRYFFLHETFDENFWNTLLTPMEHPSEASSVTKEFKVSELYLI